MSDRSLATAWRALRARGRTALIPYLTAGHPTPEASREALRRVAPLADIIEVGVPFSDPLADGPVIQRSTFRALQQGMTLARTLDLVAEARLDRPVVLFSYLNPVRRYGIDRFLTDAAAAGVAALLLTDLPAGGDPALEAALQGSPLDLIRLVTPTTSPERMRTALAGARGFVYAVARLGVTGMSAEVAADLGETVARVRQATDLPVAVGFGISTADQARQVARLADGVVVGSALVDRLEREGPAGAEQFLRGLRLALDEGVA
ncbi:MAG TPA: tryptophan synthase subunit alpha [Gemmatimonadales bacterium]|nr:tryptophan synthase subunit alpha [Gemmatimonadales bacterium]